MLKKLALAGIIVLVVSLLALGSFGSSVANPSMWTPWDKDVRNPGFEHGLAVEIDGEDYYFKGPGSIEGEIDVPGHTWVQAGNMEIVGKHYNVGPWMAPSGAKWWTSDVEYGELLFIVHGIIDVPPSELSDWDEAMYKNQGYVHFHEFLDGDGNELEDYVVYLKHIAVEEFFFDGGPAKPNVWVYPGVAYNFMPNW
jgi:hypothetical protein